MHIERDEAGGVDAALRQSDDIADIEVVDGDVEICVSLLWNEAVHVDASGWSVAELEVLDVDARLSPVQCRHARACPYARVELQAQIVQLQLVSNFVERERGVGGIGPGVVLVDDDLRRAIRLLVGELGADAVQVESGGAHRSCLRAHPHL